MNCCKCDRCGRVFERRKMRSGKTLEVLNSSKFCGIDLGSAFLDLCDGCRTELEEFMENKDWVEPAPEISVQLDEDAYAPTRAHAEDAGLDLHSPYGTIIPSRSSKTIDTGVHVELPAGTAGMLFSKSGLNVNHGILSTGLIDEGYTGSVRVKLYNQSEQDVVIQEGQKISQLVIVPVLRPLPVIVEQIDGGERGDAGFGSTDEPAPQEGETCI